MGLLFLSTIFMPEAGLNYVYGRLVLFLIGLALEDIVVLFTIGDLFVLETAPYGILILDINWAFKLCYGYTTALKVSDNVLVWFMVLDAMLVY